MQICTVALSQVCIRNSHPTFCLPFSIDIFLKCFFSKNVSIDTFKEKGSNQNTICHQFTLSASEISLVLLNPPFNYHYLLREGGIVNNTLRPPIPEKCDPDWRKLMEQCWSANPDARPSFTEVTDRLRAMPPVPSVERTGSGEQMKCYNISQQVI